MAHKNYGSISHTNTGYTNHTNTYANSYVNHTNTYANSYSNHTNTYANSYSNHSNYSRGALPTDYTQHFNHFGQKSIEELFEYDIIEELDDENISVLRDSYSDYRTDHFQYSRYINVAYNVYYGYSNGYNRHTQYGQVGYSAYTQYSQSGYNVYRQYSQSGYSVHQQYSQSGYNNHSNAGYTNHVNTTTNTPPTNVSNVSRGSAVYYKDSITLTWTAATDNNKNIWCSSRNTGSGSHADNGIWENTVLKQAHGRSWVGGYWNENGSWGGSIVCDVYGNAAQATTFINWLNSVNSVSKRYVAIIGYDEPYTNASAIITQLKNWGFSSLSAADTTHFVFAGITQTGVGVKSQQTVRRYGTSDVRVASASFTIPNVSSSQTISYYIDYCFKPIGGSYGSWTRIVNNHTSTSYAYNLSAHGNGHIKFRVLSTDGVENSASWIESSEVRVLKYTAPSSWATSEKAIGAEVENLKVEINKLATAVGTANTSQTATAGNVITKTLITDLRDKIKLIGPQISKTNPTDSNVDKITKADIDNLKNWLKQV